MISPHLAQSLLLILSISTLPIRSQSCNPAETTEAENSFKNCVDSAQAGIIERAAKQEGQQNLCEALDNMLSVCQRQTDFLAKCKGTQHAEYVRKLHLSSTADIVHSLNKNVDVQKCSVFSRKTAIPAVKVEPVTDQRNGQAEPIAEGNGGENIQKGIVSICLAIMFLLLI